MARSNFLILRALNMFAEDANLSLMLETAKLPKPGENYDSFTPAGGNGAIEIATNREALDITFKTKGMQPDVMKQFNTPFGSRRKYTMLGALVDEYATSANERTKQVQATVYGRLSADIDEHSGTAVGGVEFSIKSISKYVLQIGADEIYRFNIELGGWVTDEGQSAEIAQAIGLTG